MEHEHTGVNLFRKTPVVSAMKKQKYVEGDRGVEYAKADENRRLTGWDSSTKLIC